MFWFFSGTYPEHFRKVSGTYPEHVRKLSGKRPEMFRTISEQIRKISGKYPDMFREISCASETPAHQKLIRGSLIFHDLEHLVYTDFSDHVTSNLEIWSLLEPLATQLFSEYGRSTVLEILLVPFPKRLGIWENDGFHQVSEDAPIFQLFRPHKKSLSANYKGFL